MSPRHARGQSSDEVRLVYDVFTPTTQARVNFVPRDTVNDRLVDALRTPGKQIVVYGESGSGKSTLLQRKLEELYEDHITTRCSAASTFDSILLDAFDQLNNYYIESKNTTASAARKAAIATEIAGIKANFEAQNKNESSSTSRRVVQPQVTTQRLADALGEEGLCWVIEDFHKVPREEKQPLAQAFKIFSDFAYKHPAVKVVAIGATETAREVVEYDKEMRHRVAEIKVLLMTDEELKTILQNGASLLNINVTSIQDSIVKFSAGLPSVCHHLGLNLCLSAGIDRTQVAPVALGEEVARAAVARYVDESSDTVKAAFDLALKRHRVRRFDNTRLILSALARGSLEGLSNNDIYKIVREQQPDYPQSNLTQYLAELTSESRGLILMQSTDGRYRFSDPLYHAYAQALFLPENELPRSLDIFGYTLWNSVSKDIERYLVTGLQATTADVDHTSWGNFQRLRTLRKHNLLVSYSSSDPSAESQQAQETQDKPGSAAD